VEVIIGDDAGYQFSKSKRGGWVYGHCLLGVTPLAPPLAVNNGETLTHNSSYTTMYKLEIIVLPDCYKAVLVDVPTCIAATG